MTQNKNQHPSIADMQKNVKARNLLLQVKDTVGCSKKEAMMIVASLHAIEKQHPEYKISQIPLNQLLPFIAQIRNKQLDKQKLHNTLQGPSDDANTLDNYLNPVNRGQGNTQ